MRLGIAGISGRMGRLLLEEATKAGVTVVGGIDQTGAPDGVTRFDDIAALAARCNLVLDFTNADAASAHAHALSQAGVRWVLGTTGLDAEADQAVRRAATRIGVVQAPSFSPGVTLMMVMAERLAHALPAPTYDAEIVEMHHRDKVDAPSGTALGLGQAVASGRGDTLAALACFGRDGQAGPRPPGEIGFSALRGGQIVGEHTVSFTADAEQISITHRAFDRRMFAAGAMQAAQWLYTRPAGLYTMRDVLGL